MPATVEPGTGPPRAASFEAALQRAATALNSPVALRTVLRTLAEITLETTRASRASLFLSQDGRLEPAVSLADRPDRQLWEAFRGMPAIQLDDWQAAVLAGGEPVPILDAAASAVCPAGWAERFQVESAVVVLLQARDTPCGLLAADYPRQQRFDELELSRLGAIASLAGVALHGARSREQVRRDHELAAEHQRVEHELWKNVHRLFEALHVRADQLAGQAPPDHPWRARATELARLADGGTFQLEQAVRLLEHLPTRQRDLVDGLAGLAVAVQDASGIDVMVEVVGTPARLDPDVERALYRATHTALTAAWRHGRSQLVRIELTFGPRGVQLAIFDDGAGLGARERRRVAGHDLMAIRRELVAVHGTLRVRDLEPHGLQLRMAVPHPPADEDPTA